MSERDPVVSNYRWVLSVQPRYALTFEPVQVFRTEDDAKRWCLRAYGIVPDAWQPSNAGEWAFTPMSTLRLLMVPYTPNVRTYATPPPPGVGSAEEGEA